MTSGRRSKGLMMKIMEIAEFLADHEILDEPQAKMNSSGPWPSARCPRRRCPRTWHRLDIPFDCRASSKWYRLQRRFASS